MVPGLSILPYGENIGTFGTLESLEQQQHQQSLYGPLSVTTRVSRYQKKHSPTQHPDHHRNFISCFYLLRSIASSLFKLRAWRSLAQPPSTSASVYLLVWSLPPHNPYISLPNHYLLLQHAHTIATCFAVISRLYHLFLVFLLTPYLDLCLFLNITHPSDHSHLCSLKCHLIFFPDRPSLASV